ALDLRPQPADPHLLGACHQARGYLLIAQENRTVGDLESGIMDFHSAIDLDQTREKELRAPLAQAYCDLGEMEIIRFDEKPSMTLINRAIEHFHQAILVDPQASRLVDEPLASAHHRRGCLYHSMEAFTSAILEFEDALRIDKTIDELLGPDMAQAYAQRGLGHARRKTTDSLAEGIQDFRTALEFDSDIRPIVQGPLASSLARQAYEKLAQNSTSEAIALLQAAGDTHPDFKENCALAKLLQYQATATPEQEVIDSLQERLSEIHKQPPFRINMQPVPENIRMALDRQFGQARQFRNSGMLDESLAAMDRIIRQGWGIPFHYYFRGNLLFEMKEPEARWTIDFTVGSHLEAQGLQTPDEIGRLLLNIQGPSRARLQDQRNLGSSILRQQEKDRQRRRESQFAAAQDETRRYHPAS
ncbi:MAG: hypothetical protein QGH11_04820, partial [Pirellulaceae bacterium]|nr:hypothetical protein [Pirellulaceae bacterium]